MSNPRFGITPSDDNTGRVITYSYYNPAYASTIAVAPNASSTSYIVQQLTGALTLTASTGAALPLDKITFVFSSDSTNRVVTFGTGFSSSGTLTVTASKKATASFVYDGTSFVELSRTVTA